MHLKSLTLKGFKSFASATTLRFEPGITCVVGPNGSGKSNVVDAIAWVLGEQGAKALRGGKMDDVIFAGTAGRAPLGRAEVTLTIDNSDGALPIDYTEVSITRRLFRTGESEYEINGNSCRLLDIQELLSDSGIGREMHVIVGQGKLDSVLSARPEDRRGFIEEAAGVLKHRKRKEKALRKLDAMQGNLTRLGDLTTEIRRQLKPLGKQAQMARRAATIQADLRDARQRLLADDLVHLRAELEKDVADESAARAKRAEVEEKLNTAREREIELDTAIAEEAPALQRAQETWYRLSALAERYRGTAQLADERVRFLSRESEDSRPSRDPEALEREAETIRAQHEQLEETLEADRERLAEAVAQRNEYERRASEAEKALVAAVRAVADRREGLARLTGQVETARSRAGAAADEIARLNAAVNEATQRASAAQAEFEQLQAEVEGLDEGELDLDERHVAAATSFDEMTARVKTLSEQLRSAEKAATEWKARAEALGMGLARKDGAGALLAAAEKLPGMLGSVAALLTVEPGSEAALAAALGGLADGVAVNSVSDAVAALELLKSEDGGQVSVVIGGAAAGSDRRDWPALPEGARWAIEVISAPEPLLPALRHSLERVALVADLAAAQQLVEHIPSAKAVTTHGDMLGANWAGGGSTSAPSLIEVQAAHDEAKEKHHSFANVVQQLTAELEAAQENAAARKAEVNATLAALNESDAKMNAVAERLAQLGSAARSAEAEAERLKVAHVKAEEAREQSLAGIEELEERLHLAQSSPIDEEPSSAERDEFQALAGQSRQNEMEVRLALRTGEERARALAGRADSLERSARAEREARARAEQARVARARGAAIARAVSSVAARVTERVQRSLELAAAQREEGQQRKAEREGELLQLRGAVREFAGELDRLTNAVHRDEMARAEQRMRIEQLEVKAAEDFGVDVDVLVAEYGPTVPVPASPAELAQAEADGEPVPPPLPYHRATQEKRANRAERELSLLGKVNPLALEEFAALEERHAFLSTQLEDLKATRRDLLTVVKEVDDRIHEVFKSAFEDTAREFDIVFKMLFPGGEGRLLLTDPEDMLTTGVEVEARPPGKKVKRLSLLSGGERSLTAVALLVAIFRARPSPFYLMDEVEAALDDTNLGRLLDALKHLCETSQLIIITHQKRTMEIGDALYGVSMRGDGITQVISQRLREPA
ncbi:MAG: chromosome segregation protein SMC [Corynebacteriales bacterium]|nr:chromosome segregation protein SMC [Mycobacteriales bacterium]